MSFPFNTHIDLQTNQIKNVSIDPVAADPGAPVVGQIWNNTTSNQLKYRDNSVTQIIATQAYVADQINQIGMNNGGFSASPGLLPTNANLLVADTTIRRGDYWVITTAGSIAGIQGSPNLSVGDLIQFYGSNPATASDWLGINRNLDDAVIGNVKAERQTVALVANTPLVFAAGTITSIYSINIYNSAGQLILIDVTKNANANQRVLQSVQSLTGVIVEVTGT